MTTRSAQTTIGDHLLTRCLAFRLETEESIALRLRLLSDAASWERLFEAALERRLMPALAARLLERKLVPPAPSRAVGDQLAPATVIEAHLLRHGEIRAAQTTGLVRLVRTLNAEGIEPILVKGARSLWLHVDHWRTMRDFDLLVPCDDARRANAVLRAEGYAPLPDAVERPNRHHFELLFRADLPGWVEVHRRAGNRYAEPFLPSQMIAAGSVLHERDGARARVPDAAHHIWHGVVHHHFGHSGFARGLIDLKGLYEFAAAFSTATPETLDAVLALAARDGAGLATMDLWLAAASDLFAMPSPPGFSVPADARKVWAAMRERSFGATPSTKYPGYGELLRLGASSARAARLRPRPVLGNVGAALGTAMRLAPKLPF